MQALLILAVLAAGLGLASLLALYAYGRFARLARGAPSDALPVRPAGSPQATPLDRLVAPLLDARPGMSGLTLIADNVEAYAVRALSARRAARSLDLQLYMWRNDLTGRLLTQEITAAAERGVRVRLLLDDLNVQGMDGILLALDAHPGIEVRLFNPSLMRRDALRRGIEMVLRAFSVTRRMHNKAWIADGRIAVLGGRNIGDAYFDAGEGSNFRDLDLLLHGPAVRQAEIVFDEYWNSGAVIPIRAFGRRRRRALRALRRHLARIAARTAVPFEMHALDEAATEALFAGAGPIHWTASARVLADPPEKLTGAGAERWLMETVRPVIAGATRELQIVSPYFIPGEDGTRTLSGMAQRGVEVAVLTNSLAATDVTAVHGAYAPWRKPLIEGGVALFELKPYDIRSKISLFGSSGASLHSKSFTVDGRIGFVGSMNMDPRSISLNTEMGVLFEDAGLVQELRALFADETSPRKSYRLAIDGGVLVWRDGLPGGDATLHDEPRASLRRKLAALAIGLLPLHSQL